MKLTSVNGVLIIVGPQHLVFGGILPLNMKVLFISLVEKPSIDIVSVCIVCACVCLAMLKNSILSYWPLTQLAITYYKTELSFMFKKSASFSLP